MRSDVPRPAPSPSRCRGIDPVTRRSLTSPPLPPPPPSSPAAPPRGSFSMILKMKVIDFYLATAVLLRDMGHERLEPGFAVGAQRQRRRCEARFEGHACIEIVIGCGWGGPQGDEGGSWAGTDTTTSWAVRVPSPASSLLTTASMLPSRHTHPGPAPCQLRSPKSSFAIFIEARRPIWPRHPSPPWEGSTGRMRCDPCWC